MTRHPLDPELHILRSLARSLDGRARSELETARFALWRAIDQGDTAEARRWARACRAVLLTLDDGEARQLGIAALDAIEAAL